MLGARRLSASTTPISDVMITVGLPMKVKVVGAVAAVLVEQQR
jgi:hypothetical protein